MLGLEAMESKRFCVICLSDKTTEKWWRHDRDGRTICLKCYMKHVRVRNRENDRKWATIQNPRLMRFKGPQILVKENPRKGLCSICGKKIGETKLTAMHHIKYHDNDPLKDAIELCSSCHGKEGLRLGQVKRDSKTGRFTKNKEG